MKKFIVVLAFCVVFLTAFTRADDDEEESDEYDDEYDEDEWAAKMFASAMQLTNNNVGDINNVKVNFDGELHNRMSNDIITIIAQLMNGDLWGDDDDDDDDDEDEYSEEEEDIEECPDEGIKFISHPEECELYILCIDGNEIATLECPDGLHFSRDDRACTDPDDAGCE